MPAWMATYLLQDAPAQVASARAPAPVVGSRAVNEMDQKLLAIADPDVRVAIDILARTRGTDACRRRGC